MNKSYCPSLTEYKRRKTRVVTIGGVPMGGDYPIRVQSMTTVDTMDTLGSVEQCIRMIEAGCEYIRITAPSIKEAENLKNIKDELNRRGYNVPLVADIHFTPNAAEVAARLVEKVRVNPGNYADKKKFEVIEYNDETYQAELDRIRDRFLPLVRICKEHGTAMRIGTNHGSLSDRILSRYGDTPIGMVESALEFIRICESEGYYELVISMKASNTQVMVQAYRLLVQKLDEEGLQPYPLHLGVTEAGEAEDGRIKSAVGIGTLLEDGLGDTVRVSLTEAPEAEAPVAKALIDRYTQRAEKADPIIPICNVPIDPFQYHRRETIEVENLGAQNVPRVIADLSRLTDVQYADLKSVGHLYSMLLDKFNMNDLGADYIYTGDNAITFMLPNGLKEIVNYSSWQKAEHSDHLHPLLSTAQYLSDQPRHANLNFVLATINDLTPEVLERLKTDGTSVLMLHTTNEHAMPELRKCFFRLTNKGVQVPCIIKRAYGQLTADEVQLYASTDVGGLLIDGLGDGVMLGTELLPDQEKGAWLQTIDALNKLSFGILQAARTRMSKTEYISCPSCGRTLFDLQETTAMIRKRTDHLKGVKIGIMGCIVNGPGEMADADYGYVGVGKDKIALYRGQTVVKKSVPADRAVDELIELIREDARWIEPVILED
ncbi:(E)-4-hydroxy-3-methylbut-2-enyl-diphosphate synthase [Pontibacter sp. BT310]|uniref:4-hydroxy-3-methylbut-2-en-1-yl diphosphate synthase (flavodoxin) n=1 Tax=Pontibacter populi TaxID=890055 RepID=A0ABS6XG21_9BACT|nr:MULTISPECIES: (E)-4-hydroxy-3-methylbut-2-enyl-diphosphate synthase [Pontibacter]MBJ6120004.1 (E)-4-hydroxy-3-methylbut-2-enyl-diphosphate synthase [Pontibacter sp. BT310]MBR0572433.1 (E)-4-hydroxy-3-methylbut-2-enyl-diphosphate synthase [Microvirga sp. STS03]MBW3366857.1 (E)-4-hydroxy-3-methylbut-2-enyl-diphosphate synthase [Pontibacter populi]